MKCYAVEKTESIHYDAAAHGNVKGYMYNSKFQCVYGDSDENKKFFASTPTGHIELSQGREDLFQPGKEYYVDFTVVDA
jgi:hypothetical protein